MFLKFCLMKAKIRYIVDNSLFSIVIVIVKNDTATMSYRFLNERMTVFRENDYPKLISASLFNSNGLYYFLIQF
jgi:hypothetical protein